MTRKTKTILLLSVCGVGIICFVAYNVVKLMDTFSDKEKEKQSSTVLFSLTSEEQDTNAKPHVDNNTPTSDYELLRSKQKPYLEGQQRLQQEQDSKKQASVSFSSIFVQQSSKKKTESPTTTSQQRNSADETLDLLLSDSERNRSSSNRKTSSQRRKSYADKEYEELEDDIQTFYSSKSKRSTQSDKSESSDKQSQEAPVSDLERRRRALQDGFQIGTDTPAQQVSYNNMIPVATRGDQEVTSGQSIKLRVLENARYNGIDIPRNTIIDGRVSIANSNRLSIAVTAIRIRQQTYSVELHGYDMYGQNGLPLTVDKGKSIGSEEISDAVENITRRAVGQTTLGKIVTGSFGALRREDQKSILVLDAQKLILK